MDMVEAEKERRDDDRRYYIFARFPLPILLHVLHANYADTRHMNTTGQ